MLRLRAFGRILLHAIELVLCALCVTARARGQLPDQLTIDWDGPVACPKSERFEQELAQRLDPDAQMAQPLQIRVRVEALAGERYLLTLTTQGATGGARRSVDLEGCAEVQRAAVVLVATALSPAPAQPEAAPTAGHVMPWSLRVAGLFDVSALPRPSAGPGLGLGYASSALRLWADARYLVGRESTQPAPARVDIDLFAVGLGGAYLWRLGAIGLGPQVELELGALRGQAVVDGEGSAAAPWLAGFAGGLLEADLGPLALMFALALGVPFARPEFEAQDPDEVYTTRPVTGRAQLGVTIPLGRGEAAPKNLDSAGQW